MTKHSTWGRVRPARRHGRTALILALPRSEMPLRWNVLSFVRHPRLFVLFFFLEFAEGDFANLGLREFIAEFIGNGESINRYIAL